MPPLFLPFRLVLLMFSSCVNRVASRNKADAVQAPRNRPAVIMEDLSEPLLR